MRNLSSQFITKYFGSYFDIDLTLVTRKKERKSKTRQKQNQTHKQNPNIPYSSYAFLFLLILIVVERVVAKQHTLSGSKVSVSEYFDCLGTSVAKDGSTTPYPRPFVVTLDSNLAEYLLDSGSPHRSRVESHLAQDAASINWPFNGKSDLIEITPIQDQKGNWRDWKSRVEKRVKDLFEGFMVEEFMVPKPFWNEIKDGLETHDLQHIHPQYHRDKSIIVLRGSISDVKDHRGRLQSLVDSLQTEADRQKRSIKKSVRLNNEKFRLFFVCHIKDNISSIWQDVHISADSQTHQIIFEGLKDDVSGAQAELYTQLEVLVQQSFRVSFTKAKFVEFVLDKLHEIFNSRNIQAACKVDGQEVTVVGASDQDVKRAKSFLKSDLAEDSISFQDVGIVQSEVCMDLLEDIKRGKNVLTSVDQGGKCIEVCGFKPDVEKCSSRLRSYVTDNTISQQFIPLSSGKVRFLDRHAQRDLQNMLQNYKQHAVKIRIENRGSRQGIIVSGTEQGLQIAIRDLTLLIDSVVERPYPITKPGIQDLLNQSNGKKMLDIVQKDCDCLIDTSEDVEDELWSEPQASADAVQVLRRCTTQRGCEVVVCRGDLTKEHTDAIVNAANTDLRHVGGLAKAIVRQGNSISCS